MRGMRIVLTPFTWIPVLLPFAAALVFQSNADAQAPSPEPSADAAVVRQELTEKEQELQALTDKLRVLRETREKKEREEKRLTASLDVLETRVQEARLQLDYTTVAIEEVRLRLRQTKDELTELTRRLDRLKEELLDVFRTMASLDRRSPLETLLTNGTFTDFLQEREGYATLQQRVTSLLVTTRDTRTAREQRTRELQDKQEELLNLLKLQETQKRALQDEEGLQRHLLAQNIAQQVRVASRVAEAEEARREIQRQIFTLRNVGLQLSLKEAEDLARYAGGLTGVRPALLLGVLKVESNVGTNVGSGHYPDDVHPAHRDAFLRVTEKLGLDPLKTPVSAKPTSYAGWGGAMGPGQIMPGTWERVEPTVARLMGKNTPSPFELSDAFVATAAILQGAGAASGNEVEAVNRYFAGPNWQRFTWYGDRVLAVAKEYEARGLSR